MDEVATASSVTLGGLMAVLSLGIDLGLGQPMEHVLRQSVIAAELAARTGLGADDGEVVSFTTLLAFVGCHADSHEQARWFGDDVTMRGAIYGVDFTGAAKSRFVMSHVGSDRPPLQRALTVGAFMRAGRRQMEHMRPGHCLVAGTLSDRLGLRGEVRDALQQVFERWDGNGDPVGLAGPQIGVPARVVHLSQVLEVFHRAGGVDAAVGVARARRGTHFDPEVVDAFCADAREVLAPLHERASWEAVIAGYPSLGRVLSPAEQTGAMEAIADYVDLKSPYTLGHSRAVADLACAASRAQGLPEADVERVRVAGLLHELGRLGIPNTIWDKAGPLPLADRERVRMQPYLTERMLASLPALASLAPLAAAHQERLDGSGYPRGLRGDAIPAPARVLAAADVYEAMIEPRAHRPALAAADAARALRGEVRAGRLDGDAAEAVLHVAGHATVARPANPGGLTPREVEVLRLVARGLQSKQIAEQLVITRKTVDHHISHIYAKIGASNRVGASLFATEHGLL